MDNYIYAALMALLGKQCTVNISNGATYAVANGELRQGKEGFNVLATYTYAKVAIAHFTTCDVYAVHVHDNRVHIVIKVNN